MYMIMFVLDDVSLLDQVLKSWSDFGITGATIVESSGLHRQMIKSVPMRYSYGNTAEEESGNITLFVMVQSEKMVNICLQVIEATVGDLDEPNTGVFSAWPIIMTKGIRSLTEDQKD